MLLFVILIFFIVAAAGLAWFLLAHDHGPKEPVGALWMAAGLGLVGGVAAGILEGWLIPVTNLQPGSVYSNLLPATLAVGVIEEACKFLPLAVVLYKKPYFNEHTDGVIYFALAGLGFGLPENLLYTLEFGAKTGIARLVMTPMFHAAVTGLVGYVLAKRKLSGRSALGVVPALAAAMVMHGLYDFGLSSGRIELATVSLAITLSASIGLFVAFLHANERDQDVGLSSVGHNSFCRSCGFPNPKRDLYCTHCGKNA